MGKHGSSSIHSKGLPFYKVVDSLQSIHVKTAKAVTRLQMCMLVLAYTFACAICTVVCYGSFNTIYFWKYIKIFFLFWSSHLTCWFTGSSVVHMMAWTWVIIVTSLLWNSVVTTMLTLATRLGRVSLCCHPSLKAMLCIALQLLVIAAQLLVTS